MKGIIFDMDGTMVDNMMTHHRAWQQQLSLYGLHLSLDEVKERIHGVNTEILERLFGDRFTAEERERIAWEKEAAYRKIFLPELKLLPGLDNFLEELKSSGIPLGVASAAPPENVDFILDNLHLRPYFNAVSHAGSVRNGKPHPEVFELAATGMGIAVSDCLIFEDSVTGAEAARRAGCEAIIVTTTHAEHEFSKFDHIRKFIKDFTQISLQELQ